MSNYKKLKLAPLLKDLRDRIDEAIDIAGKNASWVGLEGNIYIHPDDVDKWLVIEQRNE